MANLITILNGCLSLSPDQIVERLSGPTTFTRGDHTPWEVPSHLRGRKVLIEQRSRRGDGSLGRSDWWFARGRGASEIREDAHHYPIEYAFDLFIGGSDRYQQTTLHLV